MCILLICSKLCIVELRTPTYKTNNKHIYIRPSTWTAEWNPLILREANTANTLLQELEGTALKYSLEFGNVAKYEVNGTHAVTIAAGALNAAVDMKLPVLPNDENGIVAAV